MPQKIVGLDIGSYSIKAAVISSTFRNWELVDFIEHRLRPEETVVGRSMIKATPIEEEQTEEETGAEESEERLEEETEEEGFSSEDPEFTNFSAQTAPDDPHSELRRFFERHGEDWEALYTALDGDGVSIKLHEVPFNDVRAFERTLPFTLAEMLPFSLEGKTFDYQITRRESGRIQSVIGVVDKPYLREYIDGLEGIGIEPRTVTVDSLVPANLFRHAIPAERYEEPVAVLDFGHRKTVVTVIEEGRVEFARTFPFGGQDVTMALAQGLDVTFPEAEVIKHHEGALPSFGEVAGESRNANAEKILQSSINRWLREVQHTLRSYRVARHGEVRQILLTGGSSRLANLPEYVEQQTQIPTDRWSYLGGDFDKLSEENRELAPEMSQAAALATIGLGGRAERRLNFRRGEFAYQGDFELVKGKMLHIIATMVVILLFLGANLYTHFHVLGQEQDELGDVVGEVCKQALGIQIKSGKKCINEIMSRLDPSSGGSANYGGMLPSPSVMELYDDLVRKLKKPVAAPSAGGTGEAGEESSFSNNDPALEVLELTVETNRIKLKGKVSSLPVVGEVTESVKTHRCFNKLAPGPTRKTMDGKTEFSITVHVDCTGTAAEDEEAGEQPEAVEAEADPNAATATPPVPMPETAPPVLPPIPPEPGGALDDRRPPSMVSPIPPVMPQPSPEMPGNSTVQPPQPRKPMVNPGSKPMMPPQIRPQKLEKLPEPEEIR